MLKCSKPAAPTACGALYMRARCTYTAARADETNGLYRIVRHALLTGEISYVGNPDSIRDYIHVEDAARASVEALGDEFRNQSVVLTGHQSIRVADLLKMLAEILGIPDAVDFRDEAYVGHYV